MHLKKGDKKDLRRRRVIKNVNKMDVHKICDAIKPIVDKYKDEENIEMEFRLGRFNGLFFDTNVGSNTYVDIIKGLGEYTGWERIVETKSEVYSREDNNTRLTVDTVTGEETLIKKERLENIDFKQLQGSPFDIRFSVSRETPIEEDDNDDNNWDRKIVKERNSYIRKNLSIDRTVSAGGNRDKDSEDSTIYQLELEIIDPKKLTDIDILFNICHKIKDIFNMLNSNKTC